MEPLFVVELFIMPDAIGAGEDWANAAADIARLRPRTATERNKNVLLRNVLLSQTHVFVRRRW